MKKWCLAYTSEFGIFLAFFDGVGMTKHCLAFFKTSGSVSAVGLEL